VSVDAPVGAPPDSVGRRDVARLHRLVVRGAPARRRLLRLYAVSTRPRPRLLLLGRIVERGTPLRLAGIHARQDEALRDELDGEVGTRDPQPGEPGEEGGDEERRPQND